MAYISPGGAAAQVSGACSKSLLIVPSPSGGGLEPVLSLSKGLPLEGKEKCKALAKRAGRLYWKRGRVYDLQGHKQT